MKLPYTLVILALAACSSSAQPARPSPTDVVATVGDAAITLADVDERALQIPATQFGDATLNQALYEARRETLDELIADHLLNQQAAASGIDRAALTEREIMAKVVMPSEDDVTAWYQANQAMVQGATLDQVRTPIRTLLVQERTEQARNAYLSTLKAKFPVKVALEPPRVAVSDGGRPARGPDGAPVTIVEFSDFECPYCQRAHPTVQKVLSTYGDRIRFIYRHYPLPNHPNARPAAEASLCADEQGQFWPYHDRLFASTGRLTVPDLKQHAGDLGLDRAKFDSCVDSGKFSEAVTADIEAAEQAGVGGTPAFFINGRPLSGAQPFEAFQQVIEDELSRK